MLQPTTRLLVPSRGFDAATAADASQLGDPHQPSHTLATTAHTVLVSELRMEPRRTIRAAAAGVDLVHELADARVTHGSARWRAAFPGEVTGFGDAKPAAHQGDRERGLLRDDEFEHLKWAHRLRSPSLAKLDRGFFWEIAFHTQYADFGAQVTHFISVISKFPGARLTFVHAPRQYPFYLLNKRFREAFGTRSWRSINCFRFRCTVITSQPRRPGRH